MTLPTPKEQLITLFALAIADLKAGVPIEKTMGHLCNRVEPLLPRTVDQVREAPDKSWFAQVWQDANHNTMPYNGSNLLRFAGEVYRRARQVPGWQLVPVEPHPEQLVGDEVRSYAGESAWFETLGDAQQMATWVYQEMLKLSPIPPHPTPNVTVWFGSMPESNGKRNWTVNLVRKGVTGLNAFFSENSYTIERTEYYGRACYARDAVRFILGEIHEEPSPDAYDPDIKEPPHEHAQATGLEGADRGPEGTPPAA